MPARYAARVKYTLPTAEQRAELLTGTFGTDREPAPCQQHPTNPNAYRKACAACLDTARWRNRMTERFNRRGYAFVVDGRDAPPQDPEPPACPGGHTDCLAGYRAGCEACHGIWLWRKRQRYREELDGISRITAPDQVCGHIDRLRGGGMTLREIARAARCSYIAVRRLASTDNIPGFCTTALARKVLAVPVPDRTCTLITDANGALVPRVPAAGTHRRIQAMCAAGHTLIVQGRKLGYAASTLARWLKEDTVPTYLADDVAALFPAMIAEPGASATTTTYARKMKWLPARYFSAATIDDPDYKPFARKDSPGVRRKLRALAWDGQGPRQVAEFIGEPVGAVCCWTSGGTLPAYVEHLVDVAYRELSQRPGPDHAVAALAREFGWAPPMAWYGIDIDHPRACAQVNLAGRDTPTQYPLLSQVFQCLIGLIPADDLVHAEKVAVVRILHRRGLTDMEIARVTRWGPDLKVAEDSVCHYRGRWGIGDRKPTDRSLAGAAADVFRLPAVA